MITQVVGNLLDAPEQYIAHQTNCVSQGAAGLALHLFKRFPHADTYTNRTTPNQPGTIQVFGDGTTKRFVINLYAQYYPGYPVKGNWDDVAARKQYFDDCLNAIAGMRYGANFSKLESIAFPFGIGCGLAGGDWATYSKMLEDFAASLKDVRVVLYQLEKK